MKHFFNNLFEVIAKLKVYFTNAGLYLSIGNFLMILATFKLTYNIRVSAYIIIPVGFVCILLLGYLDYKLIYKHQTKHSNKMNDVKSQLNRIEEKMDLILSKK